MLKKGVINKFISQIIKINKVQIYVLLNSKRDYIHINDICDGILLSIKKLSKMKKKVATFHLSNMKKVILKTFILCISKEEGKNRK